MKKKQRTGLKNILNVHVNNNKKEYFVAIIILFIGILAGVLFINSISFEKETVIKEYINESISMLKNNSYIDNTELLKSTVFQNILLAIILWFVGSTVIGIPIMYGIVAFRGFCLGYTISTILITLGIKNGIVFVILALLLQNIIFIPSILALTVSGTKLYKSILKNKSKENIKLEILRHTFFSVIMLLLLVISAFIEVYVSTNLLMLYINNI